MNTVLKTLFDLDRADHANPRIVGTPDYDEMRSRDSERREQVRSILREGKPLIAIDQYHAAWILNHGDQASDAESAYRLAQQSLDAGYEPAKWLFAAAFDRCCMYRGQPQRFGTQIVPDGQRYRLWDTAAETTDEERERYNVPPISEMHERAARDTENLAQPPMEFAPPWLMEAVARWKQNGGDE